MKVRKMWKQVSVILFLSVGLCCSAGCSKKQENLLEELRLEATTESEDDSGNRDTEAKEIERETGNAEEKKTESKDNPIFVYVCGAVARPGVYELKADARVYEAIACAGGVREDASGESINQAQLLTDGERIYIPTEEEAAQGVPGMQQPTGSTPLGDGYKDGKIHINTASKEELMALSGIGETRAESILAYREGNGSFSSLEELMNVDGIKEGIFNQIKDDIAL